MDAKVLQGVPFTELAHSNPGAVQVDKFEFVCGSKQWPMLGFTALCTLV